MLLNLLFSDSLSVQAGQSKLASQSVWGALRGLETFSQIVYQDDNGMVSLLQAYWSHDIYPSKFSSVP